MLPQFGFTSKADDSAFDLQKFAKRRLACWAKLDSVSHALPLVGYFFQGGVVSE